MSPATTVATVSTELVQRTTQVFAVTFAPDYARVRPIRQITTGYLQLWKVPESIEEDIALAVSELVTNAIKHGRGDIGLKVLYAAGEVRVEVTDGNPTPAQLTTADDDDVSGRGLLLVAALAWKWGVSDKGKTTWCVFQIPAWRS
ncbi:ATP-binding protein [Streptomyces sp. NPDC058469]|uniref:ATP-binding protein n=1 Tax=Streptomyces sp. NPDC058469 TaxID=3346514 RepID=UPI00364DAECD